MKILTKYERYDLILVCGDKRSPVDRKIFFRPKSAEKLTPPHGFMKMTKFGCFMDLRLYIWVKITNPSIKNFFSQPFNIIYLPKKFWLTYLHYFKKFVKKTLMFPNPGNWNKRSHMISDWKVMRFWGVSTSSFNTPLRLKFDPN